MFSQDYLVTEVLATVHDAMSEFVPFVKCVFVYIMVLHVDLTPATFA